MGVLLRASSTVRGEEVRESEGSLVREVTEGAWESRVVMMEGRRRRLFVVHAMVGDAFCFDDDDVGGGGGGGELR